MFQGMEYVYAVYKEKSFSRAAEKLFISQPSLSANVRRVEKQVGYPIFDRSTKPLSLTECGRQYIRAVEKIHQAQNEFSDFVNDWGSLRTGSLTLGGSSPFSSWVLPPLMADFARRYPGIDVELVEETTAHLARLLQTGEVDLLLDNCELDSEVFDRCVYREERLLLAVPRGLPVNQRLLSYQIPVERIRDGSFLDSALPAVPLSAFREEPFILLKPENDTWKRAAAIFQKNGFQPRVLFEVDQQLTSYNITSSGMGLSFIGDTLISCVPPHSDVTYYKLQGEDSTRSIFFYWKRGRYISRAMEEFLREVRREPHSSAGARD